MYSGNGELGVMVLLAVVFLGVWVGHRGGKWVLEKIYLFILAIK
jgi:hypothetical protein